MNATKCQYKVLLVDDDTECLSFSCDALKKDYSVFKALNATEALVLAQKENPNVIILDVMMPENKDGFTTFCELRNNPKTKDIPVIMLTQVTKMTELEFGKENMEQYLGKAPAAFLEKPVSPSFLRQEVEKAIKVQP